MTVTGSGSGGTDMDSAPASRVIHAACIALFAYVGLCPELHGHV